MRKSLFALALVLIFTAPVAAQEIGNVIEEVATPAPAEKNTLSDLSITTKQGFLLLHKDQVVKNLTTFETVSTKEVPAWGKWNALWKGWSIDAGFAYDANSITGAVLLGRNFGTLGDYLPLEFPLKNKIAITLYPWGMLIDDLMNHPKTKQCSGMSFIKAEIKF